MAQLARQPGASVPMRLLQLPDELLLSVLSRLDAASLCAFARCGAMPLARVADTLRRRAHDMYGPADPDETGAVDPATALSDLSARTLLRWPAMESRGQVAPGRICATMHHTMCLPYKADAVPTDAIVLSWGGATIGRGADGDETDSPWAGAHNPDHDPPLENTRSGHAVHLGRPLPSAQTRTVTPSGELEVSGEGRDCVPRMVVGLPSKVGIRQICTGGTIQGSDYVWCAALTSDGRVYEWGNYHDLSGGLSGGEQTRPRRRKMISLGYGGHEPSIEQIACSGTYSMARSRDGSVYTWGRAMPTDNPVPISRCLGRTGLPGEPSVVQSLQQAGPAEFVTVGDSSMAAAPTLVDGAISLAIIKDGERGQLWAWGPQYEHPAPLECAEEWSVRQASVGFNHLLVVTTDGYLYSCATVGHVHNLRLNRHYLYSDDPPLAYPHDATPWGFDVDRYVKHDAAGDFSSAPSALPSPRDDVILAGRVSLPEPAWQAAAAESHSVVLTTLGHVYTFGSGYRCHGGRLGHGPGAPRHATLPRRIESLAAAGVAILEVAAADDHSVMRTPDGRTSSRVFTCGLGESPLNELNSPPMVEACVTLQYND